MTEFATSSLFNTVVTLSSAVLLVAGTFFFTAGTIGLIRFPDIRSQLHALTKADNLGLGLILLGGALHFRSLSTAVLFLVAWLLILGSASVSANALGAEEVHRNQASPKCKP